MSTSLLYHALQIEGVKHKSTSYEGSTLIFNAEMNDKYFRCPQCHSQNITLKGKKERRFHLPPIGGKQCFLNLKIHRAFCAKCSRISWLRLPFMKGKSRMSRSFIRMALDLLSFSTIKSVSDFLNVGWDAIKDLHKDKLESLYKRISLKDLVYISVDEIAIAKGHKYMTIFTDIESGKVIHAVEGKDIAAVTPFLKRLNKKAVNLKAVAMDMSHAFYSAVQRELPHIDVVFDHFHVTKMMNTALDDIRKEQQKNHGNVLKGNRFLLLKNYDSLDINGMERLNTLLAANKPLFVAYTMKEQLRSFWNQKNREAAKDFLEKWCVDALIEGPQPLRRVAKAFIKRFDGLLNYFTHRISNGKAEGINNKIKTLKRQAYGFRDMDYFKLRLYHLHEQRYSLTG